MRGGAAVLAALSGWLAAAAQQPADPPQRDGPPPAATAGAMTAEQIPPPPRELADLLQRAPLDWEFYDRRTERLEMLAYTHFEFDAEIKHRYRYTVEQRGRERWLRIRVSFTRIVPKCAHRIQAPDFLRPQGFWDSAIVRHELDHVRVSSHPFLLAELRERIASIDLIERPLGPQEDHRLAPIGNWINEEVAARMRRLAALVRFNYRKLDQVTRNGAIGLDREVFFSTLYTRQNLIEAGYLSVDDAPRGSR